MVMTFQSSSSVLVWSASIRRIAKRSTQDAVGKLMMINTLSLDPIARKTIGYQNKTRNFKPGSKSMLPKSR